MFKSVNDLGSYFFKNNKDQNENGYPDVDMRKRDYGDLRDIKRRRQRRRDVDMRERNRMMRNRHNRGEKEVDDFNIRDKNMAGIRKPMVSKRSNYQSLQRPQNTEFYTTANGIFSRIMKSVKSVFSNDDQNLDLMQRASENLEFVTSLNDRISAQEERKLIKERIIKSEIFKKKLLEKRHDDVLLDQMKRGRSSKSKPRSVDDNMNKIGNANIVTDQVLLLQRKINDIETKHRDVIKELQITKKKLKFAKEKNTLLESLLDDANIDSEYVKSRRDIRNLQKENLIPESELPPSPRRTVNPLFTSSPIRRVNIGEKNPDIRYQPDNAPGTITAEYYNKYPRIPETELLVQESKDKSLSPIRIDYSKYSSPQ